MSRGRERKPAFTVSFVREIKVRVRNKRYGVRTEVQRGEKRRNVDSGSSQPLASRGSVAG
jgi:hypothetical protein